MKRRSRQPWLVFLMFVAAPAFLSAEPNKISFDDYRKQLSGIAQKIETLREPRQAAAIEVSIPDTEIVSAGDREITVSFGALKGDLAGFSRASAEKRDAMVPQLKNYVRELQNQAEAYTRSSSEHGAQQKLGRILARREFQRARSTPSLMDILLSKILSWIERLLLVGGQGRFNWFQIFIYVLIAVALIILLWWTLRRLRRPQEETGAREIVPFSPSARSWRAWLADAHSLAQQQDWRGAIHLAYWASVSFLEEHGSWRPNRARTPREYLQLLTARSAHYAALASLTRKFEPIWYGDREARETDFQETLGELEKLGCR